MTSLLAVSGVGASAYLQFAQRNTPYAATVLVATLGIPAASKLLDGGKKGKGDE
jgi:hypothetical protein